MTGKNILSLWLAVQMILLSLLLVLGIPLIVSAEDKEVNMSQRAKDACVMYGQEYGICPELLMAIIEHESGGNPKADSGDCKGLMQIYEKWHKDRMERLGVSNIYDEVGNILVGTDYLAGLFERYEEVSYVLDIYNGNTKAKYNYENGIISDYAASILERSAELERLYFK